MNILFSFTNNPASMDNIDFRPIILTPILQELKRKGHNIWIDTHKGKGHHGFKPYSWLLKSFSEFNTKKFDKVDLWIVCYAHSLRHQKSKRINSKTKWHDKLRSRKVPIIVYDHAWLPGSIITEKNNFFSDSKYTSSINDIVENNFNQKEAEKYCNKLILNNISKRPQTNKKTIKDLPDNYIFIPIQRVDDVSVLGYSKTDMIKFIKKVCRFYQDNNVPIVLKLHPHAVQDHNMIRGLIKKLKRNNNNIHIIDASIYSLMKKARFTACVNSGSIMDNFITRTPVYCCGKSMFYKSDAIVYDMNVERGLETMMNKSYNSRIMADKQLRMVWWLKNNLLFENLSAKENLSRLINYTGIGV